MCTVIPSKFVIFCSPCPSFFLCVAEILPVVFCCCPSSAVRRTGGTLSESAGCRQEASQQGSEDPGSLAWEFTGPLPTFSVASADDK